MSIKQLHQTIDEHELAKTFRKSVQTLRNDRHLRKGVPYIKLGRSVRYRIVDVLDYMERNRIDPEKAA